MSQPPQPPDPGQAQDPQEHGRGPKVAIVGCALLAVVLLLSLVAFFGVRALVPADDGKPTATMETVQLVDGVVVEEQQAAAT